MTTCAWCGAPNPRDFMVDQGLAKGPPICNECKVDYGQRVAAGVVQMDDTFKERLYGQRDQMHAGVDCCDDR